MAARKRKSLAAAGTVSEAVRLAQSVVEESLLEPVPDKPQRSKATYDLPADLLAEMRACSVEVPLKAIGGSLSGLVEMAVRAELGKLRKQFNEGRAFESEGQVVGRRGRPPSGTMPGAGKGTTKRLLTAIVKKAQTARRSAITIQMSKALAEIEAEVRRIRDGL